MDTKTFIENLIGADAATEIGIDAFELICERVAEVQEGHRYATAMVALSVVLMEAGRHMRKAGKPPLETIDEVAASARAVFIAMDEARAPLKEPSPDDLPTVPGIKKGSSKWGDVR